MKFWVVAALMALSPAAEAAEKKTAADKAADKAAEYIAKTFVAEAKEGSVAIYSNSDKPRRCEVLVNFSVMVDGLRTRGFNKCFEKDIAAGPHVFVCELARPQIVEPKIEGPLTGTCK